MKPIYSVLMLLLWTPVFAQIKALNFKQGNQLLRLTKNEVNNLEKHDLAKIWTQTDNSMIFGFIGDNHQRIRVRFISVQKDQLNPAIYHVAGKTMVKGNICDFKGDIIITTISKYKNTSGGTDNEYKSRVKAEYALKGKYLFNENKTQNHVGVFKGAFQSDIYIDNKGDIHYDDIDKVSDSYSNNQFVGTWTSYDGKITKVSNWGDYRIPNAGNFDVGAGEFSPNAKDVSLGWQSYIDQGTSAAAKREEQHIWWK